MQIDQIDIVNVPDDVKAEETDDSTEAVAGSQTSAELDSPTSPPSDEGVNVDPMLSATAQDESNESNADPMLSATAQDGSDESTQPDPVQTEHTYTTLVPPPPGFECTYTTLVSPPPAFFDGSAPPRESLLRLLLEDNSVGIDVQNTSSGSRVVLFDTDRVST